MCDTSELPAKRSNFETKNQITICKNPNGIVLSAEKYDDNNDDDTRLYSVWFLLI